MSIEIDCLLMLMQGFCPPVSEWYDSQKKPSNNFHQLLQERIKSSNPRRNLTAEESKHLSKLEGRKSVQSD
jgi:hypothetical protein